MKFETIVVDNASKDDSVAMVHQSFPKVRLIENRENVGFVRANNQAIALCQGRYVLLLNSDTQVLRDSLSKSLQFMDKHPRAGIAGVQLLNSDGTFQASYTLFPTLWREFLILSGLGRWYIQPRFPSYGPLTENGPQKINGYIEGAYLMARREAMDQIGGLDERIFMYSEDVDWCYRFRQAGWQLWYLPHASIIHYGGQSSKKRPASTEAELYRSRVYFFRKHYGQLKAFSLKTLIYIFIIPKIIGHKFLLLLTNSQRGRIVPSLKDLHLAFKTLGD
jgi:GT2 family glycosyltransferase